MFALALPKIDRDGPKGDRGEYLVGPGEVTPYHLEAFSVSNAVDQNGCRDCEQRSGNDQTVLDGLLVEMHEVGHDESGGTHGGVARGDGGADDT